MTIKIEKDKNPDLWKLLSIKWRVGCNVDSGYAVPAVESIDVSEQCFIYLMDMAKKREDRVNEELRMHDDIPGHKG